MALFIQVNFYFCIKFRSAEIKDIWIKPQSSVFGKFLISKWMYVLVNTPSRNQGPALVTCTRSLFHGYILACPWTAVSFLLKQCGRRFICLVESSNNCLHFENRKFHTVTKCRGQFRVYLGVITCGMFSLFTVSLSWGLVIVQGNGVLAPLFSVIREFDAFLRRV